MCVCLWVQQAEEEERVQGESKGEEGSPRAEKERGRGEKWRLVDGRGVVVVEKEDRPGRVPGAEATACPGLAPSWAAAGTSRPTPH